MTRALDKDGHPVIRAMLILLSKNLPKNRFRALRKVVNLCAFDFHVPLRTAGTMPRWDGIGYLGTCKHCGATIYPVNAPRNRQWTSRQRLSQFADQPYGAMQPRSGLAKSGRCMLTGGGDAQRTSAGHELVIDMDQWLGPVAEPIVLSDGAARTDAPEKKKGSMEPGRNDTAAAGTQAIHIQSLRLLVTMMLPELARLNARPEQWLADMEAIVLRVADESAFAGAGAVSPELAKAAVIGSLEETFTGVRAILGIGESGRAERAVPLG